MTVTTDDVVWCYRSILGREPEAQRVIERHLSAASEWRSLVLRFIRSSEHINKQGAKVPLPLVPFGGPAMHVDLSASASEISQLRERIREAWMHMGITRPYQSVLSAPDYAPQNLTAESIKRFFDSGTEEASTIHKVLVRNGFDDCKSKSCVEFGCGLGRVTFALAKMFDKIHAYDISPTHLESAKRRAHEFGINNIEFHLHDDDALNEPLSECDFFYSQLVFQHNPPPIMRMLVKKGLASLRQDGIAIFQLPTYGLTYNFHLQEYLASRRQLDMEMHCLPQYEVFTVIAEARCQVLEVREDNAIAKSGRWISNKFVVKKRPCSSS
jgi:SAM-dependent methyltransferase